DRRFGDADRLVSLTMDALQGVAYATDRQVSDQCSGRRLDRGNPRVEVCVVPLGVGETIEFTMTIRRASRPTHATNASRSAWRAALTSAGPLRSLTARFGAGRACAGRGTPVAFAAGVIHH